MSNNETWSFSTYDSRKDEEIVHSSWKTRKEAALVALEYVSKMMNKRRRRRIAKCRQLIEVGDRGISCALLLLSEAMVKDFKTGIYIMCD